MFLAMAACMEVKGSVRPLSSETVVGAPSGTLPGAAVGAGGAPWGGCAEPAGLAACCTCAAAGAAADAGTPLPPAAALPLILSRSVFVPQRYGVRWRNTRWEKEVLPQPPTSPQGPSLGQQCLLLMQACLHWLQ